MNLIEQIQTGKANSIISSIEKQLSTKLLAMVSEERKRVAALSFGIDEAALNEAREQHVDHALAHELAHKALYNHGQYHKGNMDSRHGGWARHDLHQWAKNYSKKQKKGTYDRESAVKGLTHAIKHSEPSYFGKKHDEKSGQTVSGATRTQAARHLLPHVEALMAGKDVHDVKESVLQHNLALQESHDLQEVLIPGHKLTDKQRGHVLSAFVHRHTHEHPAAWAKDQKPTQSDDQWVKDHAFHFNKKTGNLSGRHKSAEPHYMANEAEVLEASAAPAPLKITPKLQPLKPFKAKQAAEPSKPGKTGKFGNWGDTEADRMPWPKPESRGKSAISGFSED